MTTPHLLSVLLSVTVALASCSSDDNDNSKGSSGNKNKNTTVLNKEAGRLEFPKTKDGGMSVVVVHSTSEYGINYSVEWDCAKKAQRWTCYEMYNSNSVTNWNRNNWNDTEWSGDPFQEDTALPTAYRTTLADYRRSGYDRGHLCPSADRLCSKDANEQTFYLSNMHPQHNLFNAYLWQKMENQVRAWNKSTLRDTLYVCKGGTIEDYGTTTGVKGHTSSGLIVPKYFFMAILCKKGNIYKAIAFWAEHENINRSGDKLSLYTIPVRELEQNTGIDFFCNLPDETEEHVETMSKENILKAWGLQ